MSEPHGQRCITDPGAAPPTCATDPGVAPATAATDPGLAPPTAAAVIWHDLECGGYGRDLTLWRELAATYGGPVLDIGAGTGRVTLDLARCGHEVTALDADPILTAELARRAVGLPVHTVIADARHFELGRRFPLCIVPMQTIQLLGGVAGRGNFLCCARHHLQAGGLLAVVIVESVEPFEVLDGEPGPVPDIVERDGVVYFSQPVAVRSDADGFELERRRERVSAGGERTADRNVIRLDVVSGGEIEAEARAVGLRPAGRRLIDATADHVGSLVVLLDA